jgi:hypothetical protein
VDKVGKIVSQQGERIESVIDSLIANEMEAKDEPHSQQAEAADYKEPLCPIWTPEELIETYSNLAASIQQFVNIETGNLNPEHLSKLIETKVIKTIFESYGSGSLENTLYVKFKTIQSVRRSGGINGGKNEIEEIPIAEVYTY